MASLITKLTVIFGETQMKQVVRKTDKMQDQRLEEVEEQHRVAGPVVRSIDGKTFDDEQKHVEDLVAAIEKLPEEKKKALMKILRAKDKPAVGSDIVCGPG